jgi:hypothetical protein
MTSQPLTPQLGRKLLLQLEGPKRESSIVLDGFRPWDAWDRQRLTGFLEQVERRGFIREGSCSRRSADARPVALDGAGARGGDARRFFGRLKMPKLVPADGKKCGLTSAQAARTAHRYQTSSYEKGLSRQVSRACDRFPRYVH